MKRFLFFAVLAVSLISCQKEIDPLTAGSGTNTGGGTVTTPGGSGTPAAAGTISASIDGVATTFNTAAGASRGTIAGTSSFAIYGFKGAGGASDQISISIISTSGPLATGTYLYDDGTGNNIASLGLVRSGDPLMFASYISTTNPTKVVLTSITSTNVAGTFSGDIYQFDLTTGLQGPKKAVTNGKFNVKIN